MSATPDHPAPLSSWSANFLTRLHRYKMLLRRRWWIPALTISFFVCYQAYQISQEPPSYQSESRMMVSGRFNIPENGLYNEETSNFMGTQIELMTSAEVQTRARARLQVTRPELAPIAVDLRVYLSPRTTIFVMQATGSEPKYTQAYLDACMTEYLSYKREMRSQTSQNTLAAITDELLRLDKELRSGEEELLNFQKENNVVFLQEQGSNAASYLVSLNTQLSSLKTEEQLLNLLSLDENLERQQKPVRSNVDGKTDGDGKGQDLGYMSPETDYVRARQEIRLLEAQRDELSQNLRPKHPKIIQLNEEIAHEKKLIEVFKQQSMEQLQTRRSGIKLQIENLNTLIEQEEAKAMDMSHRMADYQRIKAKVQRAQSLYDKLISGVRSVDVNTNIDQEMISIMQNATPPVALKTQMSKGILTGMLYGLIIGVGMLFLLDRMDDRINSFTELRDHFEEPVFGQIPLESEGVAPGKGLLAIDDPRHSYAESFRNIRSSLLFMPASQHRPKTILVTSAVPGEGKSTIATNFAITMAFAGSQVLLVDADLRRGIIHDSFGLLPSPGLAEVLHGDIDWRKTIQATPYANLFALARGGMTPQPGELFLQTSTAALWQEIGANFEYVVIDSAPILATDDTPSLAPQIDGTLFVVRSAFTSARLTKNALDSLYQRQVNILGLIFNGVDTSLPEYSYYKYKQYYAT